MNSVEEARIEMEQILDSAEVLGQLQDSLGSPEAVATKDRLLANVEHLRSLSVGGGRDINLDEESVKLDEFDEQAQNGYLDNLEPICSKLILAMRALLDAARHARARA